MQRAARHDGTPTRLPGSGDGQVWRWNSVCVLATAGAGFTDANTVKSRMCSGHEPAVLDNFSTGSVQIARGAMSKSTIAQSWTAIASRRQNVGRQPSTSRSSPLRRVRLGYAARHEASAIGTHSGGGWSALVSSSWRLPTLGRGARRSPRSSPLCRPQVGMPSASWPQSTASYGTSPTGSSRFGSSVPRSLSSSGPCPGSGDTCVAGRSRPGVKQ